MQRWRGSIAAARPTPLPPMRPVDMATRIARVDWLLVLTVSAIAGIGAAMLYSAGGGSATPWAGRHGVRYAVGLVIMLVLAFGGLRRWYSLAYLGYGACFLLLVVVEVAGSGSGATRWIDLGVMRLQPSELMKIALVLALARLLHEAGPDGADRLHVLGPALLLIAAPAMLVLKQPDLGTAVLLCAGGVAILFLAGVAWWKFGIAAALAAGAAPIA